MRKNNSVKNLRMALQWSRLERFIKNEIFAIKYANGLRVTNNNYEPSLSERYLMKFMLRFRDARIVANSLMREKVELK